MNSTTYQEWGMCIVLKFKLASSQPTCYCYFYEFILQEVLVYVATTLATLVYGDIRHATLAQGGIKLATQI